MKLLVLFGLMVVTSIAVGDTKLTMYDVQRLCDERSTGGTSGPYTCGVSTDRNNNNAWWMVIQYMSTAKFHDYGQIVEMEHIKPFCTLVESLGQKDALVIELLSDAVGVYKRQRYCKVGVVKDSFPP